MAINATTLSAAVGVTDTQVFLASLTGVTAPNYQTGAGITFLLVEQEIMKVVSLIGTTGANVVRGELGSIISAHGVTCPVLAGLPADFPAFTPAQQTAVPALPIKAMGFSAPVASAATIVATGALFHVTGTTATNIITPPPGAIDGTEITIVADGVWTFTSSNVTNGIMATGTVTAATSAISFIYDGATLRWYPSRLA